MVKAIWLIIVDIPDISKEEVAALDEKLPGQLIAVLSTTVGSYKIYFYSNDNPIGVVRSSIKATKFEMKVYTSEEEIKNTLRQLRELQYDLKKDLNK